jgi:hypothetical protein
MTRAPGWCARENWPFTTRDRVGRPPIFAGGNANGDVHMLQYVNKRPGVRGLSLLVHHADDERDIAYDAGAEDALKAAAENGWIVVKVRENWKQVYSFQ